MNCFKLDYLVVNNKVLLFLDVEFYFFLVEILNKRM